MASSIDPRPSVRPAMESFETGLGDPFDAGKESGTRQAPGLKETAQGATEAFGKQATRVAQDVGAQISQAGEDQKNLGVDAMRKVGRAIDSAASEMEAQSPAVARMVHETARQIDSLSDNLSRQSVNELLRTAADFARTQPALFIGGSVVAGFAVARFLRSGAARQGDAGYDYYR